MNVLFIKIKKVDLASAGDRIGTITIQAEAPLDEKAKGTLYLFHNMFGENDNKHKDHAEIDTGKEIPDFQFTSKNYYQIQW